MHGENNMANQELKQYMKSKDVHQWQVADELKMHESSLSRTLRYELPADQKKIIVDAVDSIYKRNHTQTTPTIKGNDPNDIFEELMGNFNNDSNSNNSSTGAVDK